MRPRFSSRLTHRFGLVLPLLALPLLAVGAHADAPKPATTTDAPKPATTTNAPEPATRAAQPAAAQPSAGPAQPSKPASASESSCPSATNLLRGAAPLMRGVKGWVPRTTDGVLAQEGTFWSNPDAVVLPANSKFEFDMRSPHPIKALVLQGDNNDEYLIETSLDGVSYRPVWVAPTTFVGMGLRTRYVVLDKPVEARYLRVIGRGGDGFYSVSEVQAMCKLPAVFPPKLKLPPKKYGWDAIDNDGMVNIKGAIAVAAAVLLLLGYVRRFFDARIRSIAVRVAVVGSLTAFAAVLAWLGYLTQHGTEPAAVVKWAKVHGSTPGFYYGGGMVFSIALGVLLLCLRKQGPRVFDTALAVIGLLSFFSWWNLGHYHFNHYIHIWEHYHYYVGAKYAPELRYARLYQCTAVADVQDGLRARVKARKIRRIQSDNELGTSDEILAHPELCTSHFKDPKRWEQFRSDIRFFRSRFSRERWDESQNDHGYNATPVWGILGRWLADRYQLTWDNVVKLGLIDSFFLIAMWLAVLWAFGWRAAAVAAVYWGTNFPARFYWNGGSFLRYDWLLWLIVGICFLRKRYHFLGGAALAYSTLLRVFPGFAVAALVLKAIAGMVRERRFFVSRQHVRFAAGCVVTIGLLVPLSSWATNGLDAWPEFVHNSEKHLATALTNNMGLKTVMGYDFATRAIKMRNDKLEDPFQDWKAAKHYFYKKRAPIYYLLIVLFCVMLARAGDREQEDWAVVCLGTGLIVIAAELTCYYYGFLMTFGLLWPRRKLPGILVSALAGFTCFIYDAFPWNDDMFAAMSLGSVVVVVAATAHAAFGKQAHSELAAPSGPAPAREPRSEQPASLPPIVAEPR